MANGGRGDKSMDNTKVTAVELKAALADISLSPGSGFALRTASEQAYLAI